MFLDLRGRRALVVGDGEVAERKADALRRAGAVVEIAARFDPDQLRGCAVAIGADGDDADLQALSTAAQAAGIPVNVVDRPALCSFITPSVIDRDPLVVAVSTGGAAPVLARLVRARIEGSLPPAWGRLAALVDSLKSEIRTAFPEVGPRRRMLERALTGRVADLVFADQDGAARAEMLQQIATVPTDQGIVFFVNPGPGAPDLLTLRAHRLMGEADVIIHDPHHTEALLDMGRRDADREPFSTTDRLIELARIWQEGNPPRPRSDRGGCPSNGRHPYRAGATRVVIPPPTPVLPSVRVPPPLLAVIPVSRPGVVVDCGRSAAQATRPSINADAAMADKTLFMTPTSDRV